MAANAPNKSPHYPGNSSLQFNKELCVDEGKMIIYPKDLNIVWGNDKRYWNPPDDEKSPAELNQVYWLEVTGSVGNTDPGKEYEVGFRVSLTPDAFGWGSGSPLYVMVKRGKEGKFGWNKCTLDPDHPQEHDIIRKLNATRENNYNQEKESDHSKIYFGIYEVWSGKWKGGLKIHHAFVKELS